MKGLGEFFNLSLIDAGPHRDAGRRRAVCELNRDQCPPTGLGPVQFLAHVVELPGQASLSGEDHQSVTDTVDLGGGHSKLVIAAPALHTHLSMIPVQPPKRTHVLMG